MISKTEIRKLIDAVETVFRECWRTLAVLKEGTQAKTPVYEILNFQAQLAECLFRLDETYRRICKEKEETIKKKRSLNPDWFRRRMKLLAAYQGVIKTVIGVGRALGDSFAWFFIRENEAFWQNTAGESGSIIRLPVLEAEENYSLSNE